MKYVSVFCVMLLSVVLASCGGSSDAPSDASTTPTPEVEKATEIKIGLLAPLSGGASSYGEDAVNVATMLADEVNAGGGIDGAMVKVIPEDGACNGQSAVGAVQKLINIDGVEVIMGGLCSPETISAGKIAQAKGVTMVSALSSAPEVSNVGDHVFRYYNDLDAAKTVVAYLEDIGARNIAAIHINNEYGNAYIDAVGSEF